MISWCEICKVEPVHWPAPFCYRCYDRTHRMPNSFVVAAEALEPPTLTLQSITNEIQRLWRERYEEWRTIVLGPDDHIIRSEN